MKIAIVLAALLYLASAKSQVEGPQRLDKHVVEGFVTKALEKFRYVISTGNEELGIPSYDPYVFTNSRIRIEDLQAKLMLTVEEVAIENLSRLEVSNVTFYPDTNDLTFALSLPSLKMEGTYAVDGSLQLQMQPLFGQGPYGLALHSVEMNGRAKIRQITVGPKQQRTAEIVDLQMDLKHRAMANHFTNLVASASSGLSTRDLNVKLGKALASRFVGELVPGIARSITVFINHEIAQRGPRVGEEGNANDYLDQVLVLVRQQIIDMGLAPAKLPDGEISFSVPVWPIGDVYGGIYLHDGFIGGFETIHRVGNATLSYTDTDIYFESDLAVNDGVLGYSLTIAFMDIGPTASMTGTLSYANFYFKARVSLATGEILIEEYNIKEIGHISTEITGLGIFNWLAEIIADFAINLIKGFVKELLEGPIRSIIQWALDQILASLVGTTTVASYVVV